MADIPFAPVENYINLFASAIIYILSALIFFEGVNFHRRSKPSNKAVAIAACYLLTYMGIVISFYFILLGRLALEWHSSASIRTVVVLTLVKQPDIFALGFLLMSLYPAVSAMLRFSGLDYIEQKAPINILEQSRFTAFVGFGISLTIFVISVLSLFFIIFTNSAYFVRAIAPAKGTLASELYLEPSQPDTSKYRVSEGDLRSGAG